MSKKEKFYSILIFYSIIYNVNAMNVGLELTSVNMHPRTQCTLYFLLCFSCC